MRIPETDHARISHRVEVFVRLLRGLDALYEGGDDELLLIEGAQRGLQEALCEKLIDLLEVRVHQARSLDSA